MPNVTLQADRVLDGLPKRPTEPELTEILFGSKAELRRWDGNDLELEVTPDRLDLLCEGGLRLHLEGALGLARGVPAYEEEAARLDGFEFVVDPSVERVRPAIAGVVLRPPEGGALEAGLLDEAIRYQEVLHATIGRDRAVVSFGFYPVERLRPPIRYSLEPLRDLVFAPLDGGPEERPAEEFFRSHEMAARYGELGRLGDLALALVDADRRVLSLPPILNSRTAGEARVGDRALLLESTGTRVARVREGVGLLVLPFVARGWRATAVPVRTLGESESPASPLESRSIRLTAGTLERDAGRSYRPEEVTDLLERARLDARAESDGWRVRAPPWRPDLMAEVDLVEEVVLARGVRSEDGLLPPSSTRGRRRPETRFRSQVELLMLGLGLVPLHTPMLVSAEVIGLLGREASLAIVRPVSDQFARVRDALLPSLVTVLGRNLRAGYPQRFGEVAPVLVRDDNAESGARTSYRAGVCFAFDRAALADAAAWVDYILRAFGAMGVREPAELPGTIPGRAARLRVAGERIAEMGELHPRVLADLRVPVPAVWAEIDLNALWPLVRRAE
jgi:phenylalanyl-tRNA synthetase beta chain